MNWCGIKLNHLIPQRQDVNNLKICSQKSGILETNSDHVASFVWIQDLSLEPYHGGIRLVHLLQSIGYFVLHFHMNNEWRIRLICVNMYIVHEQNYCVDEVENRYEEKKRRSRRGLCKWFKLLKALRHNTSQADFYHRNIYMQVTSFMIYNLIFV